MGLAAYVTISGREDSVLHVSSRHRESERARRHATAVFGDLWHLAQRGAEPPIPVPATSSMVDMGHFGFESLTFGRDLLASPWTGRAAGPELSGFKRAAEGALELLAFAASRDGGRVGVRSQLGNGLQGGHDESAWIMASGAAHGGFDPRIARAVFAHAFEMRLRLGKLSVAMDVARSSYAPPASATLRAHGLAATKRAVALRAASLSAALRGLGLTDAADGYDAAVAEITA